MTFKRLIAKVKETGEELELFDGQNFKNFNRLHELAGRDYHNLNDYLMESDPTFTEYIKYKNGEPILHIEFNYTF